MKLFSLLVGINDYPTKPLRGCINDVEAIENFLKKTYKESDLKVKKLLNQEATRAGVIEAFSFFNEAKDGDTCLFYYSGHGSYMPAAKEFWTETDKQLETLVCYDSRLENGRDLANKELAYLIWRYSFGKKINFVVISDSCHSGSVTRDMLEENNWRSDRTTPSRLDIVPVEEFHGFKEDIDGEKGYDDKFVGDERRVSVKIGNHIHLGASRDNQTAKEDEIDGEHRGLFTYFLLQVLYQNRAKINYQRLIALTSSKVKNMANDQDPCLNILGLEDTERQKLFLGTETIKNGEQIHLVYYDKNKGWSVDGGSIHGFRSGDIIKIDGQNDIKITSVSLDCSLFSLPIFINLDDKKTYDAKVIRNKRIAIGFNKYDWGNSWETTEEDQEAIKKAAEKAHDFYLTKNDSAMFLIRKKDNQYFLSPRNSSWAMFKKINGNSDPDFTELIENIDVVSRWYLLKELDNPDSAIKPETIAVGIEEIGVGPAKMIDDGYQFYYKYDASTEKWKSPKLRITIKNEGKVYKKLLVKPLFLGFDYKVDVSTFNPITIEDSPQNLTYTSSGQTKDEISFFIGKKYTELGYNQITEYMKIFVSTKELTTDSFAQNGIELEKNREVVKGEIVRSDRDAGGDPEENPQIDDWQAFTIKMSVIKPIEEPLDKQEQKKIALGLELKNNSLFSGKIGFSTASEIKQRGLRGIESIPGTALLHETKGNDIFQPAELVANHGQGQSLNVIEIFDAQNTDSVNDQATIEIVPEIKPIQDEAIVAFGYDVHTNSYYPIGFTNKEGNIIINQLPEETVSDSAITQRSFVGSIKIYFYKVVGQKIGLKYKHPELAIATVDANEKLEYVEKRLKKIKEMVADEKTKRIVLFIHGIIGDTEEMVKVVRRAKTKDGILLNDRFDLILTFDYENLGTKIDKTAIDLKKRLKKVGLVEGHTKELVIIAHSMGGLVSRFFIEKSGGDKIVNHLIMLGTPNGGSEWADVRDLAEVLISSAIGGAAFLKPWLLPLSFVGKLLKPVQLTLKQMNNTGDLSIIPTLNDGTIPDCRYSIIAGNTKLLDNSASIENALKRVVARIKSKPAYAALDLVVFRNEENDIAVKVKNIKKINHAIIDIFEVASDHISYFGNPASVKTLGDLF